MFNNNIKSGGLFHYIFITKCFIGVSGEMPIIWSNAIIIDCIWKIQQRDNNNKKKIALAMLGRTEWTSMEQKKEKREWQHDHRNV